MSEQAASSQPRCPFCGSQQTELQALYGSMALMSQYYCHGCRSVFDYVRDAEPPSTMGNP